MQTQALLEQLSDRRFRVTGNGQLAISAEGTTQEEAIANFQRMASLTLRHARMITVDIPIETVDNSKTTVPITSNLELLGSIGRGSNLPDEDWNEYLKTLQELREVDNARNIEE